MINCALIDLEHDMFKALKYYLYDMAQVKLTRSIYILPKIINSINVVNYINL